MPRLTEHFRGSEFPGWADASPAEREAARKVAVEFLQPIRTQFGRPVIITSWLRDWGSGAHLDPETVDFVVPGADLVEVHQWATTHLAGRYGELLYELARPGQSGPHIHRTRPGVGGWGESLREVAPGEWVVVPAFGVPGIGVEVGRRRPWWWLVLGLGIFLARRR